MLDKSDMIVPMIIITLLTLFLAAFVVGLFFLYQHKQVEYFKQVNEIKMEHEKQILKTQLEIQEGTFEDISKEIHDNIGLTLTLAKLHLNSLPGETVSKSEKINQSVELIGKAIVDLNDLSKSMKSDIVTDFGLVRSLEYQVNKVRNVGSLNITQEIIGEPFFLDSMQELILYRVSQEAINNVLKHASAKNIKIVLRFCVDQFRLEISDDGVGFNDNEINIKRQSKVMAGLSNIERRIRLLSGSVKIESVRNQGTSITVIIPV